VAGYTKGVPYADIMIPAWAAGFSAYGCACADYEYRYDATTDISIPADPSGEELERVAAELAPHWEVLRGKVRDEFAKAGIEESAVEYRFLVRMQYAGQLNDIEVATASLAADGVGALVDAFEAAYGRIYAQSARSPELGYVVTSAVATGITAVEKPILPVGDDHDHEPDQDATRPAWWSETDGFVATKVFDQEKLKPGARIVGPAIVEAPSSTFAIPPGRAVRLDRNQIFHLT
jgi:N-methylhydantoinase A/oxoprolinase/acetone carboxylase beta subunit